MIQQARQHDIQTLEASPLDALLDRPYVPGWLRRPVAVYRPAELLPSRWEVIERIMAKHGHCPDPNLEIVCDAIFAYATIPTTGKLYIDCYFIDCNLEVADGYWELIDSVVEGGVLWAQIWDGKGGATVKGNVRI